MRAELLSVEGLSVRLCSGKREILEDISFSLSAGKVLGVVGGSGSGKTTLGLCLLRLLPPSMEKTRGRILYRGEDVEACTQERMRALRGAHISMVFQEPAGAFDPLYTVGAQITETLRAHPRQAADTSRARVMELLSLCGVNDARRVADSYPHELSGGLLQRAMIAQAVACSPGLLVADEPTSSLDVRVQAGIMELFMRLKEQLGLAIVLITHDLGLVRHFSDDVLVLNRGTAMDLCSVSALSAPERNSYTRQLLDAEGL